MQPCTLRSFLDHLRQLTDPARVKELSDAELLERFRSRREEAAFTLLVQRHGPMVQGVCRRVLGDQHDTEDAFQATFLVLVRNAGAVRKQQSLASFLYGVACRVARKTRAQSACRRRHERAIWPHRVLTDPLDPLMAGELRAALDEEIAQLPIKYRKPLILCYLAEKTHEQAARELGWPKSSVTARLARARQLLQQRLTRRGFTVPAGLLAVLLTEQSANAAVPASLMLSTVRLAVQAFDGKPLAAATIALTDSVVKGTCLTKWTAALTLLTTIGLVAAVGHRLSAVGSPSKHEGPAPKTQPAGDRHDAKPEALKPRVDRLGDPLPDEVVARMGSSRMRHGGHVRTLAFAPDGKSLVSGGGSALRIWDTATGKLRRRFDVATDWCLGFAIHPDSILVANAGPETGIVTVQILDLGSGEVRGRIEMPDRATFANLVVSRDGKRLAYTHNNAARFYDPATGRPSLRIPVKGPLARDIAFAPDGKTVAICDITDTVHLHDTSSGKSVRELKHEGDTVAHVAFSPDGRFLASIPWNDKQQEVGEISIWDVTTGKEHQRLKGVGDHLYCAAFSPDSKYVATSSPGHDLILWDTATGKEVRRYPTDAHFGSIAFSPDGKSLAAASAEGTIRLWDIASGRVLPGSADPFLNAVHHMLRFSANGRRLLGNASRHIVWYSGTGQELRRLPKVSDRSWLSPLSPDESLLVSADREGTIRLYSSATGEEVRTLKGHEKWVRSLVFAADGRRLFSSSFDGTIRVWDVASGRQLRKLTGQGELA